MRDVETVYPLANALGRFVLRRVLGFDIAIHGNEHIPRTGPVIVASNHVSFLDFMLVELAAIPRRRYVRFLTRYDAWTPGIGWVMDQMGHVPVDRAAPAHAFLRSRSLLRRGEAIGIFPEAGVSLSFTVRPLMRGAVALARETGTPVVPLALWGPQRSLGPGVRDLRRGYPVDIAVGEPIGFRSSDDLVAGAGLLGARLQQLLDGLQRIDRHQPRPGEHAPWHPAHLGGQAPGIDEALERSVVPRSAVPPTWSPSAGEERAPQDPS